MSVQEWNVPEQRAHCVVQHVCNAKQLMWQLSCNLLGCQLLSCTCLALYTRAVLVSDIWCVSMMRLWYCPCAGGAVCSSPWPMASTGTWQRSSAPGACRGSRHVQHPQSASCSCSSPAGPSGTQRKPQQHQGWRSRQRVCAVSRHVVPTGLPGSSGSCQQPQPHDSCLEQSVGAPLAGAQHTYRAAAAVVLRWVGSRATGGAVAAGCCFGCSA
jgi:hypothetical protein